jgi:hypothetical protein
MVMSVQGGQRARSRAVTVQLCKLCWQEGAARCRTCTHWEGSQGRLSSPLRNTHSHCTLHAHKSPADSRRTLETRASHRAAALQCRTKADHEWRSLCWPLFSSTHSTACSSPSPIAHRRRCYTTTVAKTRLLPNRPKEGGSSQGVCLLSAKRYETQFWIRLRPVTEAAGAQNTGLHESLRPVAVTARDGRVGD